MIPVIPVTSFFPTPERPEDTAFFAAYGRIRSTTQAPTMRELAALLGVKQSHVSDVKRRRVIPASWLLLLLVRYNISPQWILHGTGPSDVNISGLPFPLLDDATLDALVRGEN